MSIEELGPRLGRALVVLGDWGQAEELAARLPIDDSRVRLLRSELRFVRGDFDGAKSEAEMALMGTSADRVQVLIRLADIDLYLGNFSSGQRYGHAALEIADESGSPNLRARCIGIIGATEFFGGSVETAYDRFMRALDLLNEVPEVDRDRMVYTTVLGNLGCIAEARKDWQTAERYHREALRLRREVADARGVLHSLHALGRSYVGLGDRDAGEQYFTEAEQLAADLDETLERAKIHQTQGELRLKDGDCRTAQNLISASLESFVNSSTRYDIAHARLALSSASKACVQERQAVEHGAAGRCLVEAMGYGLLRRMYPDVAYDVGERIAGSLTAYALGDALGTPWENTEQTDLTAEQIEQLPTREDWPRGATSDDTALTLLTARHLAGRDGKGDAQAFLAELAERAPLIRGLGPSTRAAIEHFRNTSELPMEGGATNGAPMRALPIGWVIPHSQHDRRRRLALEMAKATHPHPSAQIAACVIASCASWAVEGAPRDLLLDIAIEEARESARLTSAEPRLADMLADLSAGNWRAPADGIGLDPCETVTAVLSVVVSATSLREALIQAVQLRGDTDTVAALAGALLGAHHTPDDVRAGLPWHRTVLRPQLQLEISDASLALATARAALSD